MKYALLAVWLLSMPFLLKSFGLLPYGYIVPRLVYSWNGGMTISALGWKLIYRESGWPSLSRVQTFGDVEWETFTLRAGSESDVAKMYPDQYWFLLEQAPDYRERIARGETVTFRAWKH